MASGRVSAGLSDWNAPGAFEKFKADCDAENENMLDPRNIDDDSEDFASETDEEFDAFVQGLMDGTDQSDFDLGKDPERSIRLLKKYGKRGYYAIHHPEEFPDD